VASRGAHIVVALRIGGMALMVVALRIGQLQ